MKQIPALLLQTLVASTHSHCFLVKLASKRTGEAFGFTTSDKRIIFDDGYGSLAYDPTESLTPQNIQETTDIGDADNTEAHGWFSEAVRVAIDAGVMDGAEATIYRVDYEDTAKGAELVMFGVVGKVKFETNPNSPRKVEIKGLDHFLKIKKNALYSITCRNDFGDARCGKTFEWVSGTITAVTDGFLQFSADVVGADGYFDSGVVRFDSGDNAGAELEIETWKDGVARLSFATPYHVSVGDSVSFRRDCNKFAKTCIETYSNILNFNGEHLTPVQDKALMVPGAYIKNQGAK